MLDIIRNIDKNNEVPWLSGRQEFERSIMLRNSRTKIKGKRSQYKLVVCDFPTS